jgi:HAD superfamily hydrolase (TIGR01450 family)
MTTTSFSIDSYDAVVFDLDGTLWLGGTPLPGAAEFIERCRMGGARVMAATNISITPAAKVRERLVSAGLFRVDELVMTASVALAATAKKMGVRHAAVLAGEGIGVALMEQRIVVHEVPAMDRSPWLAAREGHVLAMGGWPEARLGDIETVGQIAANGTPLLVTSNEPGFPAAHGWEPGAGMMLAAAKALHRFEPIVCGKPSQGYADAVRSMLGDDDANLRLLMVGDSQLADIGLAQLLGADSLQLVGRRAVASGLAQPTFVADDLRSNISRWTAIQ